MDQTGPRRTALITGASAGIGLSFARVFAEHGFNLVLTARREDRLQAIAAGLAQQYGVGVRTIAADLADPDAPKRMTDELTEAGIAVDVLVNNAGFGLYGPFTDTAWDTELQMLRVNIVALTALTKLLLPGMVARRYGRILNVGSTAAFQPGPLMAVYYATKAYVLSFSEALANELAGSGVTVTALCPGPTASEFQSAAQLEKSRLVGFLRMQTSDEVARAGYEALMKGKPVVVPGLTNWLGSQSPRFFPRRWVTAIVRRMQDPRQA